MIINILIYLTFIVFSLGQLGRVSLLNQQVNFYLYELVMAVALAIAFFNCRVKPLTASLNKYRLVYIFLGYLLATFLINLPQYGWQRNLVGFLYWSRLAFYWLVFVYLGPLWRSRMKSALTLFIGLTVISSLMQLIFYPDLRNLIYLGWDPHYNRLFGVFFDTSVSSAIYGLIFLYLLVNKTNLITIVIYLVFIILTYSRSVYISFLLTICGYLLSRRQFKLLVSLVLIFITGLLFIPTNFGQGVGLDRLFSIVSRLKDYEDALFVWKLHPLIGIGYNHISHITNSIAPFALHSKASYSSSYLIILVTGGIIGLGLFGLLLYRLIRSNKQAALYVVFLGLLSFTDNILLHPFMIFLLGSVLLVGDR